MFGDSVVRERVCRETTAWHLWRECLFTLYSGSLIPGTLVVFANGDHRFF